jgi:hypothetical protein
MEVVLTHQMKTQTLNTEKMKTITFLKKVAVTTACICSVTVSAQDPNTSLAVLGIGVRGIQAEASSVANMTRFEVEKVNGYVVLDKNEVNQVLVNRSITMDNCTGKACLAEVGRILGVEKMFTGSIEDLGKTIVFTYRLLDTRTGEFEKTYAHEFLNLPEELRNMTRLAIAEMFGLPYDANLMNKLSKPFELDNSNNNPQTAMLELDGPRLGFVGYTGEALRFVTAPKSAGGLDAMPVMFQFGYQFEKQYLNEGSVQALFEFIPMVTGLDQGLFIPSLTLLHGLRSNVSGWEFAIGPSVHTVNYAKGYYDPNGNWQLESDWSGEGQRPDMTERMDYRGSLKLNSAFVIAFGKTFRSGRLNIPFNFFVIPGKHSTRFGISFGFNAKYRDKY